MQRQALREEGHGPAEAQTGAASQGAAGPLEVGRGKEIFSRTFREGMALLTP